MPADRYWEFEDEKLNLAAPDAGPTDLLRLLLIEFGLVAGVDWFLVPVEVPVGSVLSVASLAVRDTFGEKTDILPVSAAAQPPWGMFEPSVIGSNDRLRGVFVLPPTFGDILDGDPLEEVALFRDEMANLAWAVERIVPGAVGERRDRAAEQNPFILRQTPDLSGASATAELIYRLQTPVPPRWLPLVPARHNGAVVLRRLPLMQVLANGEERASLPAGRLLAGDGFRLANEEVPREGVVARRAFRYARWTDGRAMVWLGRRKRVGSGEGESGLRFDSTAPSGG